MNEGMTEKMNEWMKCYSVVTNVNEGMTEKMNEWMKCYSVVTR